MASIAEYKNRIHVADCSTLDSLKEEVDDLVISSPSLLNYAINHPYREFNKRKMLICQGSGMITPYDAGYRPINYVPSAGSRILLESGDFILLESGDKLLLE